jgi:hypothetical protein
MVSSRFAKANLASVLLRAQVGEDGEDAAMVVVACR